MKYLMLTCDVEAMPSAAAEDHVNRLILGKVPGAPYAAGIGRMMDIADSAGAEITMFLDVCERTVYGDQITDVARQIIDRGHDLQLHLHTEFLPADFWSSLGYQKPSWGMHQYNPEAARRVLQYAAEVFADMAGFPASAYRAGAFRYNQAILEALPPLGIELSFNYNPMSVLKTAHAHGFDAGPLPVFRWSNGIVEIPLSCVRNPYPLKGALRYAPFDIDLIDSAEEGLSLLNRYWAEGPEFQVACLLMHSWSFLALDKAGRYTWQGNTRETTLQGMLQNLPGDVCVVSTRQLRERIRSGEVSYAIEMPLPVSGTDFIPLYKQPLTATIVNKIAPEAPAATEQTSPAPPVNRASLHKRAIAKAKRVIKASIAYKLYRAFKAVGTQDAPAPVVGTLPTIECGGRVEAVSFGMSPVFLNHNFYRLEYCNICGAPKSQFYASWSPTPNRCGRCHSFERHRIFKWAYDWFIRREFPFDGKEVLVCTPGDAESRYILSGAKRVVSFDIRPVDWFDMQMDICDMSQIPDESFDCFLAIGVLQHTKNDEKAIDEIHRVLRKGGRFFTQASNILNGKTQLVPDVTRHYGQEDLDKYGVGTYRVYGDVDLIKLLGRKFIVKTYQGFDPVLGGWDFYACGIKE